MFTTINQFFCSLFLCLYITAAIVFIIYFTDFIEIIFNFNVSNKEKLRHLLRVFKIFIILFLSFYFIAYPCMIHIFNKSLGINENRNSSQTK